MKKIYALASALTIVTSVFAQTTNYADKVIAKPYGTISSKLPGALAKVANAAEGDTINISPNSADNWRPEFGKSGQLFRFGYTTGGYVFGKNADSLNICAQGFQNLNLTPVVVTKALFWVYEKGNVGSVSSVVKVELWNMANNKAYNTNGSTGSALNSKGPNTKLSSVNLTWADIDTTGFSIATFSTPVVAGSGDFAIAVNCQGLANGDSLGILSDKTGDAANLDYTFHRYSPPNGTGVGAWVVSDLLFSPTGSNGTGGFDANIAIFAVLGNGTAVKEYVNGVKLNALYPNPTKDMATIAYSLEKESSNVSLVVYDVKGAKAYEETFGTQQAGEYKINLNTSSLEAGSYFYQLKANGRSITKEFVVVK